MRSALLLASTALALLLTGCPKDETTESCNDYVPPASFDPQTPAVSFSKDIMPIFKPSCAFTNCHGLQASSNGVFLGDTSGPAAVHSNLVGRRATALQTMELVKAGDPRQSFLMRKVDGSQCTLDAQCTGGTCGDSMPRQEEQLPLEDRDKIRRWIAQGAKND